MSDESHDAANVAHWIRDFAHPLAPVGADGPLADLAVLADRAGDAVVVGIGTTTRAGHELSATAHRLLRLSVETLGFRALALLDDESVVAAMDDYARTGAGDPRAILGEAWVPWRTAETLAVLEWARQFNVAHPHDPLRLFGLAPEAAKPAHYEHVARFVEAVAPQRIEDLRSRYETIVTAHQVGEHIQRANGTHPGRPFSGHAAEALTLVESLPGAADAPGVLDAARLIARYHANSTASGRRDFAAESADAARRIADWHDRTGHRVVFWEGVSNTAVARQLTVAAMAQRFPSTGLLLREHFGSGYLSVAITFHHGSVRAGLAVPAPSADFVDSVLDQPGLGNYLLDLRTAPAGAVQQWLHRPGKLRLLIGTYDPTHDTDHHITGAGLGEWFDIVLRIRTITPTHSFAAER
ncbi:erythromycin esterase family protein [Nocardia beijingensis]|uniref:erythromycin esterase family protein n=1 Tax=Nocardia beijingensis TaxID=95162 RepID=UPI0018951943|nr:erythromycin esterase family protein [Nocardia beijingensis]MBF6468525.1 erythromycin esterase family protein [Nocardia beijingensis]